MKHVLSNPINFLKLFDCILMLVNNFMELWNLLFIICDLFVCLRYFCSVPFKNFFNLFLADLYLPNVIIILFFNFFCLQVKNLNIFFKCKVFDILLRNYDFFFRDYAIKLLFFLIHSLQRDKKIIYYIISLLLFFLGFFRKIAESFLDIFPRQNSKVYFFL